MDIVERLRDVERHEDAWNKCDEAADEIDRLRQQKAELMEALKDTVKLLEYIGEQRAANKLAALIAKATGGE